MPIRYIPNDPLARDALPTREVAPRLDRPANRPGFIYFNSVPEDLYAEQSPSFLYWQCREAALAGIEVWEKIAGDFRHWAMNRHRLRLVSSDGAGFQPSYDRLTLSFPNVITPTRTAFSSASVDLVAHELGHAFLDSIRPDLWQSDYFEVAAFHEAFADCFALVAACSDVATQVFLISHLVEANPVEAIAEDLADAVATLLPVLKRREREILENSSAPRRARNDLTWADPDTLPPHGPPERLTRQPHSFSRVFTGSFWELIIDLTMEQHPSSDALSAAVLTAGRLLVAAVKVALDTPRFFEEIARGMMLADAQLNGSTYEDKLRKTFGRHGINPGTRAPDKPTDQLSGAGLIPSGYAAAPPVLSEDTHRDLLHRFGASEDSLLSVSVSQLGEYSRTAVGHRRQVYLDALDPRLRSVIAVPAEYIVIGQSGSTPWILGTIPERTATEAAVFSFVRSLLLQKAIDFHDARGASHLNQFTHTIHRRGGQRILTRTRLYS